MNQLKDLREMLFKALEDTREGKMDSKQAQSINSLAQTLINTGKLEIEFLRTMNSRESTGFITGQEKVLRTLGEVEKKS